MSSTAISPETGTADSGRLFSRDSLDADLTFHGAVAGELEHLEMLRAQLGEHARLELGGRTSVMGSAEVTCAEPAPWVPQVPRDRVVLRLASPTILLDPATRPSLDLHGELRRQKIAGTISEPWTRTLTDGLGGFHAASRMPKPVDVGLAAGTTVVINPAPGDAEVLTRILQRGLGVRRSEGFGWMDIATEPWQPPGQRTADDEPTAFAAIEAEVQALGLRGDVQHWFRARLRDVGSPHGPTVAEAMTQPRARGLSVHQRDVVARLLSHDARAVRHAVADALSSNREPT
jgi:CRISPR-associated protein Csx10